MGGDQAMGNAWFSSVQGKELAITLESKTHIPTKTFWSHHFKTHARSFSSHSFHDFAPISSHHNLSSPPIIHKQFKIPFSLQPHLGPFYILFWGLIPFSLCSCMPNNASHFLRHKHTTTRGLQGLYINKRYKVGLCWG